MFLVIIFGVYMHTLVETAKLVVAEPQECAAISEIITEQSAGKQFAFCIDPRRNF